MDAPVTLATRLQRHPDLVATEMYGDLVVLRAA
jgi:hypothetical protein